MSSVVMLLSLVIVSAASASKSQLCESLAAEAALCKASAAGIKRLGSTPRSSAMASRGFAALCGSSAAEAAGCGRLPEGDDRSRHLLV